MLKTSLPSPGAPLSFRFCSVVGPHLLHSFSSASVLGPRLTGTTNWCCCYLPFAASLS
ncbi:hypothetical protein Mapa_009308 [Marchantia paleacea]|nr:hypothetical protein Mapa_009308 [Marchantia paleacea]